jgi:hypothetical protein
MHERDTFPSQEDERVKRISNWYIPNYIRFSWNNLDIYIYIYRGEGGSPGSGDGKPATENEE